MGVSYPMSYLFDRHLKRMGAVAWNHTVELTRIRRTLIDYGSRPGRVLSRYRVWIDSSPHGTALERVEVATICIGKLDRRMPSTALGRAITDLQTTADTVLGDDHVYQPLRRHGCECSHEAMSERRKVHAASQLRLCATWPWLDHTLGNTRPPRRS